MGGKGYFSIEIKEKLAVSTVPSYALSAGRALLNPLVMTVQTKRREVGNLIIENIPHIPSKLHNRLHYYHNIRWASFADWCPRQGGMLVSTRDEESTQIHYLDAPDACSRQLTFSKEPILSASMCPHPDHEGFLFAKDKGGNERYQLWYYDIRSASCELLTDGVTKTGSGMWNPAGTAFLYTSNKRNQVDQDVYLYDFADGSGERLVMQGKGYWYPVAWDRQGKYISLINYRSINESHLYIMDTSNGQLRGICTVPEVACQGGLWSADERVLYFASDQGLDQKGLMAYDFSTGCISRLVEDIGMETENMALSPDGQYLAFVLNDNGASRLYLYDLQAGSYRPVSELPEGVLTQLRWHPAQPQLAMTLNRSQAPADVFVFDLETAALRQWTVSDVGGLVASHFVAPRLIRYLTFDEVEGQARKIPAFYYRPQQPKTKIPVLIYIHGGPESQFRPSFSPAFQYYVKELGVAVLAPNVRGSTGYGKHYLKLDNGYKREHAVRDIGKLLDWIAEQPELDSQRVAVMGGSYGGYMVLASMAHYSDRLCCGIDIFGISNFVTFLENTKSYRRALRRVEYGDERDPLMRQHLQRISPTTNAHKITKPMMIVQGLNDPRVPVSEAEQMVKAIRENGGEAWYLLAKDEGHGFSKKSNRDFYDQATILFLKRYLLERAEF